MKSKRQCFRMIIACCAMRISYSGSSVYGTLTKICLGHRLARGSGVSSISGTLKIQFTHLPGRLVMSNVSFSFTGNLPFTGNTKFGCGGKYSALPCHQFLSCLHHRFPSHFLQKSIIYRELIHGSDIKYSQVFNFFLMRFIAGR